MKKSYELLSKGKTRNFMEGRNFHSQIGYDDYWPQIMEYYYCSDCKEDELKVVRGIKRIEFFEEFIEKTKENRLLAIDPVKFARFDKKNTTYDSLRLRRAKKSLNSFLKKYPECKSINFDGSLIFYDKEIQKGIRACLDLYENKNIPYHGSVFDFYLIDNKSLLTICPHENLHFISKSSKPCRKFCQVYRFYTGLVLDFKERKS